MTDGQSHDRRRGVTRGYVVGLAGAAVVVALALLIAVWGMLGVATGREPVTTAGIPPVSAEAILLVAVLLLAFGLWRQALVLLRGRRTPPWAHTLVLALGAYFVWCLGGILVGMSIDETWVSPYGVALAIVWAAASLLFWAVLARRVYTDRPVPRWPHERHGDEDGPDWTRFGGYDRGDRGDDREDSDGTGEGER